MSTDSVDYSDRVPSGIAPCRAKSYWGSRLSPAFRRVPSMRPGERRFLRVVTVQITSDPLLPRPRSSCCPGCASRADHARRKLAGIMAAVHAVAGG